MKKLRKAIINDKVPEFLTYLFNFMTDNLLTICTHKRKGFHHLLR